MYKLFAVVGYKQAVGVHGVLDYPPSPIEREIERESGHFSSIPWPVQVMDRYNDP